MKAATAFIALSLAIAAWLLLRPTPPESPASGAAHVPPPRSPAAADVASAGILAQDSVQGLSRQLENASDLRQVYEQYRNSSSALEKNIAYRAWSACFPAFIAAKGEAMDLEKLRAGLPPDVSEQRLAAIRSLFGRCRAFSDMTREQLVAATEAQKHEQARGAGLAPGELAAKLFIDGDAGRALSTAQQVIRSQDPYALNSLKDYIYQYWATKVDSAPEFRHERADLRALAFSMAACQLGLDCGASSLTALLQCAHSGACEGSVSERYLHSLPSEADRTALRQESERTLEAIRRQDYAALGLSP